MLLIRIIVNKKPFNIVCFCEFPIFIYGIIEVFPSFFFITFLVVQKTPIEIGFCVTFFYGFVKIFFCYINFFIFEMQDAAIVICFCVDITSLVLK